MSRPRFVLFQRQREEATKLHEAKSAIGHTFSDQKLLRRALGVYFAPGATQAESSAGLAVVGRNVVACLMTGKAYTRGDDPANIDAVMKESLAVMMAIYGSPTLTDLPARFESFRSLFEGDGAYAKYGAVFGALYVDRTGGLSGVERWLIKLRFLDVNWALSR